MLSRFGPACQPANRLNAPAPGEPMSTDGGPMIKDHAAALLANGGTPLPGPAFPGRYDSDQTARAAHRSHLPGSTGRRWLMPAAEMAGLADGRRRRSPDPGPAGSDRLPRIATCTPGASAESVRAARDFT